MRNNSAEIKSNLVICSFYYDKLSVGGNNEWTESLILKVSNMLFFITLSIQMNGKRKPTI